MNWTIQLERAASHILYHPSTLQFLVATSTSLPTPNNNNNHNNKPQQQQHGLYLFSSVVDSSGSCPLPLWIGLPVGSGLGACRGLALYKGTHHNVKEEEEENAFVVYFDASLYTPVIINIQTGVVMSSTSTTTQAEFAEELERASNTTPSSSSFILSRVIGTRHSQDSKESTTTTTSRRLRLQTMPDGHVPLLLEELCGMASHVALAPSKIVGTALASGLRPRSRLLQVPVPVQEQEDVLMADIEADDFTTTTTSACTVDANGNQIHNHFSKPKPIRDDEGGSRDDAPSAFIQDYSFLTGLFSSLIVEGAGRTGGGGGGGSRFGSSSGNQQAKPQVIR